MTELPPFGRLSRSIEGQTASMAAEIETRFESKSLYDFETRGGRSEHESITGYLSLKKPTSPLSTIELDEDSFELAYSDWLSFVHHALGLYASRNADKVATVYTYSTGPSPSVNSSRGELHREHGWHNAVFFGVVGRAEVLDTIRLALVGGAGVPPDVVNDLTENADKRSQIHCDHSPDSIDFRGLEISPSFHIEDGSVWCPYEQGVWYTHFDWRPQST